MSDDQENNSSSSGSGDSEGPVLRWVLCNIGRCPVPTVTSSSVPCRFCLFAGYRASVFHENEDSGLEIVQGLPDLERKVAREVRNSRIQVRYAPNPRNGYADIELHPGCIHCGVPEAQVEERQLVRCECGNEICRLCVEIHVRHHFETVKERLEFCRSTNRHGAAARYRGTELCSICHRASLEHLERVIGHISAFLESLDNPR